MTAEPIRSSCRVAVCYRLLGVQKAVETLARSELLTVQEYARVDALLAAGRCEAPQVIVVDLFLSGVETSGLRALLDTPGNEQVQVILVSNKPETPEYRRRAESFPRARLICRDDRFISRLSQGLAEACGCAPRREFHGSTQLRGTVSSNGMESAVRLENIGLSGAKVVGDLAVSVGSTVWLQLTPPGCAPLALEASVVRRYLDRGSSDWHLGLEFGRVTPAQLRTIRVLAGETITDDAPANSPGELLGRRMSDRIPVPARMKLKVRLKHLDSATRFYASVVDVSESGIRAVPLFGVDLVCGQRFEANLVWNGKGISGAVEVVRKIRVKDVNGEVWHYGLHFLSLEPNSRGLLPQLNAEAKRRGVSAGGVLRKKCAPAASSA